MGKRRQEGIALWAACGSMAALLLLSSHTLGLVRSPNRKSVLEGRNGFGAQVRNERDLNKVIQQAEAFASRKEIKEVGMTLKSSSKYSLTSTENDYTALFSSDAFDYMSSHCCKTLYFPPDAENVLPTTLSTNGIDSQKLRDFVGNGNTLVFNGASSRTIRFLNQYFGLDMQTNPIESDFSKRASYTIAGDPSTPSAYFEAIDEAMPATLKQTPGMIGVDTSSLPDATAVVYNNFPRVPTVSPLFLLKYCQIPNPYIQDGSRLTLSAVDCGTAQKEYGAACQCGQIVVVGWDWTAAKENLWEHSIVDAQVLAEYFGQGIQEKHPLVSHLTSTPDQATPHTVVDRAPQGLPSWGMDPLGRDIIPEFDVQSENLDFWSRDGGWRNICGPRKHPVWDPRAKKFYYEKKAGWASNYVKHWCNCWPKGVVETGPTKDGVDIMGCEEMPDARLYMAEHAPGGRSADAYYYTGPGYDFQRVIDKHDDLRIDPRYPSIAQGNGGDSGVWMDENDAGPPEIIDDRNRLDTYAADSPQSVNLRAQRVLQLKRRGANPYSKPIFV